MGGNGSGRWRSHFPKHTVDESLTLSTRRVAGTLNEMLDDGRCTLVIGTLSWSRGEEVTDSMGYRAMRVNGWPVIELNWTTTSWNGEQTRNNQILKPEWTLPNYGGRRWWWRCPLLRGNLPCNRRVAKLCIPPGGRYFGCRQC